MKKGKGLSRSSLRERKVKTTEETRREMIGSRYIRRNFVIAPEDDYLLEDIVKRIRRETGMEITKSAIVRRAIRRLKGEGLGSILGEY